MRVLRIHSGGAALVLGGLAVACQDAPTTPSRATPVAPTASVVAGPATTALVVSAPTEIPPLGGSATAGTISNNAAGINDAGVVVGTSPVPCAGCTQKQTPKHGFRWLNGTLTDLGTLGGKSSRANAINNNGVVVGAANTAAGAWHATVWLPNGARTDLGTIGGPGSEAMAINDRGYIVGESDLPTGGFVRSVAVVWKDGKATNLGVLPGGDWSVAQAVDSTGSVIVGQGSTSTGNIHAIKWTGGKLIDLGTLGGWGSVANGIDPRDRSVGYADATGNVRHAIAWTSAGAKIDLGALPNVHNPSEANATNRAGDVVGDVNGSPQWASGYYYAQGAIWQGSTMTLLPFLPGGSTSTAYAVNNTRMIAGTANKRGTYNFITRAVVWRY
jgi:probable HAF family extracellular repeat protein